MESLPNAELIDSIHTFPCNFTFKVIGKTEDEFSIRVVTAVREELGYANDPPHTLRETSHGRHVAVTVEPLVFSSDEVLSVYTRLRALEGLVMLL